MAISPQEAKQIYIDLYAKNVETLERQGVPRENIPALATPTRDQMVDSGLFYDFPERQRVFLERTLSQNLEKKFLAGEDLGESEDYLSRDLPEQVQRPPTKRIRDIQELDDDDEFFMEGLDDAVLTPEDQARLEEVGRLPLPPQEALQPDLLDIEGQDETGFEMQGLDEEQRRIRADQFKRRSDQSVVEAQRAKEQRAKEQRAKEISNEIGSINEQDLAKALDEALDEGLLTEPPKQDPEATTPADEPVRIPERDPERLEVEEDDEPKFEMDIPDAPVPESKSPLDAPGQVDRKALAREMQRDAYMDAQKRQLRQTMGPMALVGGLGASINLLGAYAPRTFGNIQDRYVAEQLDKPLVGGMTAAQERYMQEALLAPTRAAATEARKRREAQEATSQARTSAAAQMRGRRLESENLRQAQQKAGLEMSRANMAAAAEELRRREQMIAYQGQRQRQALDQAFGAVGELAGTYGKIRAGKSLEVMDPTDLVLNVKTQDGGDIDPQQIESLRKDVERAGRFGKVSSSELQGILDEYGASLDEETFAKYAEPDELSRREKRRQEREEEDPFGEAARRRFFTGL